PPGVRQRLRRERPEGSLSTQRDPQGSGRARDEWVQENREHAQPLGRGVEDRRDPGPGGGRGFDLLRDLPRRLVAEVAVQRTDQLPDRGQPTLEVECKNRLVGGSNRTRSNV